MNKTFYLTPLFILLFTGCSTNKVEDMESTNPFIGSWSYIYSDNGCVETYQYLENGIRLSNSNEERVKARYSFKRLSKEKNLYLVADTVLEDNAKKDCAGSTADMTDDRVELYVTIKDNPKRFTFCVDEDLEHCVGPFIKQ